MKNKDLQKLLQKYPDDMEVVLYTKTTTYDDLIDVDIIETRYSSSSGCFYIMDNFDDDDWRRETKEVLMIY